VNIAARLDARAQPGDIVVWEAAVQTTNRTGYSSIDLATQRLRNIVRPMRVHRIVVAGSEAESESFACCGRW